MAILDNFRWALLFKKTGNFEILAKSLVGVVVNNLAPNQRSHNFFDINFLSIWEPPSEANASPPDPDINSQFH